MCMHFAPDKCLRPFVSWHIACCSQWNSSGPSRKGTGTDDCRYHYLQSSQPPPNDFWGALGSLKREREPASSSFSPSSLHFRVVQIHQMAGPFLGKVYKGPSSQLDFCKSPSSLERQNSPQGLRVTSRHCMRTRWYYSKHSASIRVRSWALFHSHLARWYDPRSRIATL